MAVDVIIPTLDKPHAALCREYITLLPSRFHPTVIWSREGKNWPSAINAGLKKTDPSNDVILMDDDIFLTPRTFTGFEMFMGRADIFGFKLLFPDGKIQHAGGIVRNGNVGHRYFMEPDKGQADDPVYLPHVTTSLIYIRRRVLNEIGGMAEDYPGEQMEDVDFCLRAIKKGFKILYLPFPAIHLESATKKDNAQFRIKMTVNMLELKRRYLNDPAMEKILSEFPKPYDGN